MQLLAWNVSHQTRQKLMPVEAARALAALKPDVVVLTEYVESAQHELFFNVLADGDLQYRETSH